MIKEYTGNSFSAVFTDEGGYFSLTGDANGGSGAIGNELVGIDSRFEMLNEMHLSDAKTGEPMHALENGYYHFKKAMEDGTTPPAVRVLENYWHAKLTIEQKDRISSTLQDGKIVTADQWTCGVVEVTKDVIAGVMEEIRPIWKKQAEEVRRVAESIPEDLTDIDEDASLDDYNYPEKVQALAQHLGCHFSAIEESGYDDNVFQAEGKDWLVVSDAEAEDLWDQDLDNCLVECIYPELPENMRKYFDDDAWKRDARMDGRAHSLGRYDGNEYDEAVDGETYYIYRQ